MEASSKTSATGQIEKNMPTEDIIKINNMSTEDTKTGNTSVEDKTMHTPVKNYTKATTRATSINDVASPSKRTKFSSLENMSVDDVTKSCEAAVKMVGEESMSTVFDKCGLETESFVTMATADRDDSLDLYGDL